MLGLRCRSLAGAVAFMAMLAAWGNPSLGQGVGSGRSLQAACKAQVENTGNDPERGVCIGIVWGVLYVEMERRAVCPPADANIAQAIRHLLRFMDKNLGKLDSDLAELAMLALHEAWPCRRRRS